MLRRREAMKRDSRQSAGLLVLSACAIMVVICSSAASAFCGGSSPVAASRAELQLTARRLSLQFADPAKKLIDNTPLASKPMSDAELATYMKEMNLDPAAELVKGTDVQTVSDFMDFVPAIEGITFGWIGLYILGPAFILFLINMASQPLQDKIMGEEVTYDFSGKNSRITQIFAESGYGEMPEGAKPLPIQAQSDMPAFSSLQDARAMREDSDEAENLVKNLRGNFEKVVPAESEAAKAQKEALAKKQAEAGEEAFAEPENAKALLEKAPTKTASKK